MKNMPKKFTVTIVAKNKTEALSKARKNYPKDVALSAKMVKGQLIEYRVTLRRRQR